MITNFSRVFLTILFIFTFLLALVIVGFGFTAIELVMQGEIMEGAINLVRFLAMMVVFMAWTAILSPMSRAGSHPSFCRFADTTDAPRRFVWRMIVRRRWQRRRRRPH